MTCWIIVRSIPKARDFILFSRFEQIWSQAGFVGGQHLLSIIRAETNRRENGHFAAPNEIPARNIVESTRAGRRAFPNTEVGSRINGRVATSYSKRHRKSYQLRHFHSVILSPLGSEDIDSVCAFFYTHSQSVRLANTLALLAKTPLGKIYKDKMIKIT